MWYFPLIYNEKITNEKNFNVIIEIYIKKLKLPVVDLLKMNFKKE